MKYQLLFNIIKQEFLGILTLSLPLIFVTFFISYFSVTIFNIILGAIIFGLYVFLINYNSSNNFIKNLKFEPSKENNFEKLIKETGLNIPVTLRYSYLNDMIAASAFSTIKIDPLIWHNINNDPQAIEAIKVIDQYIMPQVSEKQKTIREKLKQILTEPAQNFIIRHELAHVYYNFSIKKLILTGSIAALSFYFGFIIALYFFKYISYFAIIIGIITGGFLDIFLSYLSNLFFRNYHENKADKFAARFSNYEEINHAADFFEKYYEITYDPNSLGILSNLPNVILTGYLTGKERAKFLRSLANAKKIA